MQLTDIWSLVPSPKSTVPLVFDLKTTASGAVPDVGEAEKETACVLLLTTTDALVCTEPLLFETVKVGL